ncbi:MAG TPA: hypothetical protein VK469_16475 [Candidatus Kapabacteria bacterium]|nr:hypothetical protein [Candidatus Kapabacteria bacterium]
MRALQKKESGADAAEENLRILRDLAIRNLKPKSGEDSYEKLKETIRKYQRSERGIITLRYSKMKKSASKYNMPLLSKAEFERFSSQNEEFDLIFHKFRESGYQRELTPVIRMINPGLGFEIDNLRWVPLRDKTRCGNIIRIEKKDGEILIFPSFREAERVLGLPKNVLGNSLKSGGKYKKL